MAGYKKNDADAGTDKKDEEDSGESSLALFQAIQQLKKRSEIEVNKLEIKEGENLSSETLQFRSMILAMENAGQLIDDEELRSQIKEVGSERRQPGQRS